MILKSKKLEQTRKRIKNKKNSTNTPCFKGAIFFNSKVANKTFDDLYDNNYSKNCGNYSLIDALEPYKCIQLLLISNQIFDNFKSNLSPLQNDFFCINSLFDDLNYNDAKHSIIIKYFELDSYRFETEQKNKKINIKITNDIDLELLNESTFMFNFNENANNGDSNENANNGDENVNNDDDDDDKYSNVFILDPRLKGHININKY